MIEPETRSGLGWPAADSARPDRHTDAVDAAVMPSSVGWPDDMVPNGSAAHAAEDERTSSDPETEDDMSHTTESTPSTAAPPVAEGARSWAEMQEAPSASTGAESRPDTDAASPTIADQEDEVGAPAPSVESALATATDYSALQSGSLADLDTPIAREAAAALMITNQYHHPVPRPAETRVMVVSNQKGGVGKTTSAVNLAASLAVSGLKVLVIDLDPQGNASTALSIDHNASIPNVYDVLVEERTMSEVVQQVEGFDTLWCVPATIDLAGAEIELVSLVARESRLRRGLEEYLETDGVEFDYVFIDCPPSLGLLTVNALVGGDEVLIPIQCEYYALEGLSQLLKNIDMVRAHLNPSLAVTTILLTMYDGRTRLAAQVADEVRRHFGDTVLRTTIPRSVRISEAPSYGQTVMTYDPASTGALSYMEAARELAEAAAGHRPNKEDAS